MSCQSKDRLSPSSSLLISIIPLLNYRRFKLGRILLPSLDNRLYQLSTKRPTQRDRDRISDLREHVFWALSWWVPYEWIRKALRTGLLAHSYHSLLRRMQDLRCLLAIVAMLGLCHSELQLRTFHSMRISWAGREMKKRRCLRCHSCRSDWWSLGKSEIFHRTKDDGKQAGKIDSFVRHPLRFVNMPYRTLRVYPCDSHLVVEESGTLAAW